MRILFVLLLMMVSSVSFASDWGVDSGRLFKIGHEANGRSLFLCRANYLGSEQPGKTWAGYNHCNFAYGGREVISSHYSVYRQDYRRGHWVHGDGHLPWGAMPVGRDSDGKTLYLCRAYYAGGVQPGKTWANYRNCNIPYAGREVMVNNYQVFVSRSRTPHHRSRHHHARGHRQCLRDNFGNEACGYGCVKSIKGVKCASRSGQQCMADDFGNISCGYNCIKTIKGVFCAAHRSQSCVSNAFGDVQCGRDCSVNNFGQFSCH